MKRGFKRGLATVDDAAKLLEKPQPLATSKFRSEKVPGAPEQSGSSSSN